MTRLGGKLSVVRWPGGCFVSGYHWKDGVGKTRKPVADPVWGVTDPNTFGTDEFIEWCRLVGCEPYICTNAGNGTPEEMKQWVQYCNATVAESGNTWAIALVNRHPSETLACAVKLGDRSLDGTFDTTILAGDSPEAYNDVERPDRVVPEKTTVTFDQGVAHLPPHSLVILRIR